MLRHFGGSLQATKPHHSLRVPKFPNLVFVAVFLLFSISHSYTFRTYSKMETKPHDADPVAASVEEDEDDFEMPADMFEVWALVSAMFIFTTPLPETLSGDT